MIAAARNGAVPEHNVTGVHFADRGHFRYNGPVIDIHAHLYLTRASDPPAGPPIGSGPGPDASLAAAETMLAVADEFAVVHTVSMCLPAEVPLLRERFGSKVGFNGWIGRMRPDEPVENAYRVLERFLAHGVRMLKFWAAPRGRDLGLLVDAPWRLDILRQAKAAGVRTVMVHVADPDALFRTAYADVARFGTKADQYAGLRHLLEEFPDVTVIAAHMGGDPEHPDHLEALLEAYPNLLMDTSATKWQVREVSRRPEAFRSLFRRYPRRFLFGVDLVTRHHLEREHYVSRYWCLRTLWESHWEGPSPIADPDHVPGPDGLPCPTLRGLGLPNEVLKQLYFDNASRVLRNCHS
jgi:predicted TIM-barrel fold metal-dependent hydrolase